MQNSETIKLKIREHLLVNFTPVVKNELDISDYIEGINIIQGYDINLIAGNIMSLIINDAVKEFENFPKDINDISINERIEMQEIIDEMIAKIFEYLYN
jgi:uncharacterized protein with ACT and thioredoxin-like domain